MKKQGILFAILISTIAVSARAQIATIENKTSRLEFIGLRRWTPTMMQDSLRYYSPKDSLFSHTCAAVLQSKLHFADVSVTIYPSGEAGRKKGVWLISVIEPQDSNLVQYQSVSGDSLPDHEAWRLPIQLLHDENEAVQFALGTKGFLLSRVLPAQWDRGLLGPALPLRAFLRSHQSEQDLHDALWTIAHDRNHSNRAVAALLMLNFSAHDAAWIALVEALRDPEPVVDVTAQEVLQALSRERPRQVDWTPAVPTLRLLLNGTNLFAHTAVLRTLAATSIQPSHAAELFRGGGSLVLAKLGSSIPPERRAALELLVQLARHRYSTRDQWARWLSSL